MPECQKLKLVGLTSVAKCKDLTRSALKGLRQHYRAKYPHAWQF